MIDERLLAYDFDEEQLEVARPIDEQKPSLSLSQKFAYALVGLGTLALIVQSYGGPLWGTWLGVLTSYGAISVGFVWAFVATYAGSTPGIKNDGVFFNGLLARGALAWIAGVAMTAFYVLVYWQPQLLGGLVRTVDPITLALIGKKAGHWDLYGVIYTLAILVFGVRMFFKYRHNRYQLVRTASVMVFQLGFAFLLPNLLVRFQKPYMEFNGVWPLKYDYLWPTKITEFYNEPGALGTFLLFWGLAGFLLATPILTYFFGKRWYCSWVCGCGGLAETLGDPWRQLSDKSTAAWKVERWMIHSVLIFVFATTGLLWANSLWGVLGGAADNFRWWYGFLIGAVFSGVVGVGFYPLLGSRVWCRFGCPQAALLGLFQRFFSRFRITTNGGQCMSCGNCSTYCEMGIDVRAYAQSGENIVRSSCVGCGVCAAVCPRGVLKLENGKTHADRFEGADQPLRALARDLSHEPAPPGREGPASG